MRLPLRSACAAALPALALLLTSTPAQAGKTCDNLWCQASDSWSDSGFGSSFDMWTGVETKADHPGDAAYDSSYLKAGVEIGARGKVLGKSRDLANVTAIAYNNQGEAYGLIEVEAVGTVLVSAEMTNTITYGFDRTFFKADDGIKIAGFKVTVKGEAGGGFGVDVAPTLQDGAIGLSATPFANAYAKASAKAGGKVAGAGVSGSATLVEFAVPLSASASIEPGGDIGYNVDSSYDLHALDGKLNAWIKVFGKKHKKTLFSFNGPSSAATLVRTSGTLAL